MAVAGLVVVLLLLFVAVFAPLLAGEKPVFMRYEGKVYFPAIHMPANLIGTAFKMMKKEKGDLVYMLMPPVPYNPNTYDLMHILERPSLSHLLGTDGTGRDVLSQMIWGSRVSISVGFVAVGIAVIIGIFLGLIAGYYGGFIDILISRTMEVMICFPTFFLILAILAFVGPSIYNIMVVIGFTGWTGIARIVRGECIKFRGREFVVAAKGLGAGPMRIIFKHLLPNTLSPVLVVAAFGIGTAILVEAALSFLGFGVGIATPSWGRLLSGAQQYMDSAWWLTLAPGFAIFVTVTAYNLIGEGLRDAIDPGMKI